MLRGGMKEGLVKLIEMAFDGNLQLK